MTTTTNEQSPNDDNDDGIMDGRTDGRTEEE